MSNVLIDPLSFVDVDANCWTKVLNSMYHKGLRVKYTSSICNKRTFLIEEMLNYIRRVLTLSIGHEQKWGETDNEYWW